MSKAIKCDMCKRTTPDISVPYNRRKKWSWFKWNYDSQGGSYEHQDLCEGCWKKLGES